jgi:hypothetical protein
VDISAHIGCERVDVQFRVHLPAVQVVEVILTTERTRDIEF